MLKKLTAKVDIRLDDGGPLIHLLTSIYMDKQKHFYISLTYKTKHKETYSKDNGLEK